MGWRHLGEERKEATMERILSEYAAKLFTEVEVRDRLADVITSEHLVNEFTGYYVAHTEHVRRTLLGPHDGDDWDQWRFMVEDDDLTGGAAMVEAGRVLWNDTSVELPDAEVDARQFAVIIHAVLCGFDDSWYELYGLLDMSVDEDPRKYGVAKDLLTDGRLPESARAILSSLSDVRDKEVIEELDPVVRRYAMREEKAAYPVARTWARLRGDHEEAKYWAYKMGDRPTPF